MGRAAGPRGEELAHRAVEHSGQASLSIMDVERKCLGRPHIPAEGVPTIRTCQGGELAPGDTKGDIGFGLLMVEVAGVDGLGG